MLEMLAVWIVATGMLVSKLTNSMLPMWVSLLALGCLFFNKKGSLS